MSNIKSADASYQEGNLPSGGKECGITVRIMRDDGEEVEVGCEIKGSGEHVRLMLEALLTNIKGKHRLRSALQDVMIKMTKDAMEKDLKMDMMIKSKRGAVN